ncbi:MAG: circularly permuted type 2 ATP-grasp protein [Stellaceae bacterium]
MSAAYDEMVTGNGALRPHWRALMEIVWTLAPDQLGERLARVSAQIADDDEIVTLPERGGAHGRRLDLLPLILPAAEWQAISAGMVQRARLLDMILADLYGPQRLLEERLLPPYLVLGNPAFLRPLRGVRPRGDAPQLYFYAADLVRLPSGEWRVFADRTQAPGGVGYALHHRSVLARTVPEMFRATQVQRLDPFIDLWQSSLRATARDSAEAPQIVLLTPGPYNDAYFEHVFLARALGITLVQSSDLTVRDDYVYLKTLDGLQRVDVIYRRVDGDYCDSLELREDSALGIAGLVQVARARNVALLNLPGSALVEAPAFTPFLPELCRRLLGGELRLPAVTTWWCGQERALGEVRAALDGFAVHSVFDPDPVPLDPALLAAEDRAEFEAQLARHPERFVARQKMMPSAVPCLVADEAAREDRRFVPKPVVLRVMALWRDGDWVAMPGGLARIVTDHSIYRSTLRHGGVAKDVWVLSEQDADAPLHIAPAAPVRDARPEGALRSRTADDLFWLGRHVERLDAGTRQFQATLHRLASGGLSARDLAELGRLAEALKRTGWIGHALAAAPVDGTMFLAGVIDAAIDGTATRICIEAIRRLTLAARDQLSRDMWRTLHHLTGDAAQRFARAPREPDRLLEALDATIATIAAFAGLAAENMARGAGWRFLDLGRRIERGVAIAQMVGGVMTGPPAQIEAGLRLALELCDSTTAYLQRDPVATSYAEALAFVLADRSNPRSLLYQLVRIERHLGAQAATGRSVESRIPALTAGVDEFMRAAAPGAAAAALLDRATADLMALSDAIMRAFFTHTASAQLTGFAGRSLLTGAET